MDPKLVTITQEQLDQVSEALGRVVSMQELLNTQQKMIEQLQADYGRIPKRGIPLPGQRWAGAQSDQDSDDIKRGFLHWLRCISSKKTFDDTPEWVTKSLKESSDTAGGHLVPEIFIPELVRIIEERAMMRSLVRVITMTTDTSNLPSLTSGMTVYWPGETNTITQGDPVFGKVTLNAKTMAALTSSSLELAEDSQLDLAGLLATLFGEAIADEEDRCILVGNNDPFYGLLHKSSVNQVTMGTSLTAFSNVSFGDIVDLIDSITSKASRGARFFLHKNILAILKKIRDLNHQYIWAQPAGTTPGTIWGYPYTESDQMPNSGATGASTNFLAFGNPGYIFLGTRKQMTVDVSDHVGFKQNERFWKVTERIAVAVAVPAAFGRLRTAA